MDVSQEWYSVDQVAERLGLHVRTVRGYVRDGRLRAVRIGKQYRIAHEDLAALTRRSGPAAPSAAARDRPRVEVSSIVEVDGIDRDRADRLTTLLTASAAGSRDPGAAPLRVQAVHDAPRGRLKIVVLGGAGDTAELLRLVEALTGEEP